MEIDLSLNNAILREIQGKFEFPSVESTNDGESSSFYSLGKFESMILNKEIYMGFKVPNKGDSNTTIVYFCKTMANIEMIKKYSPLYRDRVPLFTGLVEREGQIVGLVTEDFSQNNTQDVIEYRGMPGLEQFLLLNKRIWLRDRCLAKIGDSDELRPMDLDDISWKEPYVKEAEELTFNLYRKITNDNDRSQIIIA